ncbi:MAG: Na/Pi cotransporter family protein [Nannocystales bacterium]
MAGLKLRRGLIYSAPVDGVAIGTLIGGVGLFLLGMNLMTDSLAAMGGDTLRTLVGRLIHRRSGALATGIVTTALLQSSSATTLVTVGFVSAGLVTFSDSLGIILGANIGTTATSWLVSLIGLKFKVSAVALPLVGAGALLRLVSRGRRARLAQALSGFGLIFVGIDVMQDGMAGLDVDFNWGEGLPGPLRTGVLVGIGAVMTVVMQSSSAAAATTLIALSAGRVELHQAAALVIGQNVGTTVTAILGASGGSLSARRTAVAHVLFNVLTALVALLALSPFLALITEVARRWVGDAPQTVLALFHTGFNVLGVALVYPWLDRFAKLVERIVPRSAQAVVADLPKSSLSVPAVALESARMTAANAALEASRLAVSAMRGRSGDRDEANLLRVALDLAREPKKLLARSPDAARELAERIQGLDAVLTELTVYLGKIDTPRNAGVVNHERVALLHAVDHVRRLVRVAGSSDRKGRVEEQPELRALADPTIEALEPLLADGVEVGRVWIADVAEVARRCGREDRRRRDVHREHVLERLGSGELEPGTADQLLAAARWVGKTPKHVARAFQYLGEGALPQIENEEEDDG